MKKSMRVSIVLLAMYCYSSVLGIAPLDTIIAYARSTPENPISDNNTGDNLNFSAFHYQQRPNAFTLFIEKLGYTPSTFASAQQLKNLLHQVTTRRTIQGLLGNQVAHLTCNPTTSMIIWTDLYGAFHSWVRALIWLKEQAIINDELKIIKDNYYFVFNGNLVDKSAYTMETLVLALMLMERNPERVFYMRGQHETQGYWRNFSLKRELLIRAQHISNQQLPLEQELLTFFNTLPLALYLSITGHPKEVVRISPFGRNDSQINVQQLGNLFSPQSGQTLVYHELAHEQASVPTVDVLAIIKSIDVHQDARAQQGLGLVDQDQGASAWGAFSSPTFVHQKMINFAYDAFCILKLEQTLPTSTLSLYQQHAKTLQGFRLAATYNLLSGIPTTSPLFTANTQEPLHLGSTMALIGGVPIMGQQVKRGSCAAINEANQSGGINGRLIRFTIYNDDYIPHRARENVNHFLEQKIDLLISPIGSPTLNAYLDYVKEGKISVFFPLSGAETFRSQELTHLINFRAGYHDEVFSLIDNLYENYGIRKFAFIYQDDSYGQGPLAAAREALKKKGITDWTEIPYARTTIDFTTQVKKIEEAQPDAIGFFATAQAGEALITQAGLEEFANKQIFGISFFAEESFRQFAKRHGLELIIGSVVPNPLTSQLLIAQEYRKAMDLINGNYDVFSFEAYITTSIFVEIARHIKGPITAKKLIERCEALHNFDFKGLSLSFNPRTRSLAHKVWIETRRDQDWSEHTAALYHRAPPPSSSAQQLSSTPGSAATTPR